jgi:hypothetical protein
MSFFSVLIEGNGLSFGSSVEEPDIAGFFTTRVVWAKTPEQAGHKAIELVLQEWRTEPYVSQPGAKNLTLIVSECHPVGFVSGLFNRPSGFTFFASDPSN